MVANYTSSETSESRTQDYQTTQLVVFNQTYGYEDITQTYREILPETMTEGEIIRVYTASREQNPDYCLHKQLVNYIAVDYT